MSAADETDSPPDHYAVFRLRDFRLYLTGRLAAVLGQQMVIFTVGWEIYQRTHSAIGVGPGGPDGDDRHGHVHTARRPHG